MSTTTTKTLSKRVSQREIYQWLHARGTAWLKSHVLYADRQVVVLNKPPGLVCQLRKSKRAEPSSKGLDSVFKDIKQWIPSSEPCTVHRLDKPTTGCLLVALNSGSARSLTHQFGQGTVLKYYLALVRGGARSFGEERRGSIAEPIVYRDGRGEVHAEGKAAMTEWEVLGSSSAVPLSLLRLGLVTGNKHQLRIHLAKVLNAPILGDSTYSLKPLSSAITDVTDIPTDRLFLHSSEVSFHKFTERGKRYRLNIRAPVPLDFRTGCEDVGIDLPYVDGAVVVDEKMAQEDVLDRSLWDKTQTYD